jgi:hypothetical protein
MNDLRILTYRLIDGIPTLKDSEIIQIYNWMKNDKTLGTVFYNVGLEVLTEDYFLKFWKRKDLKMFVLFTKNKVAGLIWFDRIIDATASIHINAFKWTWGGNNIQLFRKAVCQIFRESNIDVMVGQIPSINFKAIKFSERVGFIKSGIIPKSLYVYEFKKKVDAYISYAVKDHFIEKYLI